MISIPLLYSFIAILGSASIISARPTLAARACTGPPVNPATIDLIAEFEGFVPNPYLDPVNIWTIGYGHQCADSSCSDIKYTIPLSDTDGKALLAGDLTDAQQCITLATADPVVLNINQYGALVSWAFNVGCGQVRSSSLLARLNAREDAGQVIRSELPLWNRGGGEVLPGLVRRRAAEVALADTPTDIGAIPAPCS
ncbi:hypothetical protein TWF694_006013 [Orbilia ellipsospora]|uniref:Lysozyme n=1 Tax=Orbilia ellipsospora TaxID=2528407 RepID=A0AAV9WQX9_9PEZI